MFGHQLFWRNETLTTWIAGVRNIFFLIEFVSGQFYFVCIDNNYVITAVYVRGERWLVLPSNDFRHFRRQAPQNLALSINNYPTFVDSLLVG